MPKKITAVLMLIVLCVGLCACGGNNPAKSDLAVIDTETNESIYIGQPKDEIEELYGVGERISEIGDIFQFSYCDDALKLGFDENDYVDSILFSTSLDDEIGYTEALDSEVINDPNRKNLVKEERFKTRRGLKVRNTNFEFRKMYDVDVNADELAVNVYKFTVNDNEYWISPSTSRLTEQLIISIWIGEKEMLLNGQR